MRMRHLSLALIAFAPLLPQLANGGDADDLVSAVSICLREPDDAGRLACYDRAARAHVQDPASGKFGYEDVREREERAALRDDTQRSAALEATIIEVSRRPNGAHVMTLDNGQIWVESSLDPFFRVAAGEPIRIKRAALGTYLLSTPSNRSTRVTRTQ
ncbi:MAG: hypothetical protein WAW79_06600 [Steroidobacteraceae bacterium]